MHSPDHQPQPAEPAEQKPESDEKVEPSTPLNQAALQFQGDLALRFYERGQTKGESFDDSSEKFDAFWTEERKAVFRHRLITEPDFAQLVLDRDLKGALEKMGLRLEE